MNKYRDCIRVIVCYGLLGCCLPACVVKETQKLETKEGGMEKKESVAQKGQGKPNIIFLMADDLGWVDISSPLATAGQGSTFYETPNIDFLAEQGMSFNHAYSQQNCQPSRTALISGQYAPGKYNGTYNVHSLSRYDKRSAGWPNITIEPYEQVMKGIRSDSTSLFEMLKGEGYHTAWFGKNHGTGSDKDLPRHHGIDHNFAASKKVKGKINGKKTASNYWALKDNKKGWIFDGPLAAYAKPYDEQYIKENLLPYANGNDPMTLVGKKKHFSDGLTDAVVGYLRERSQSDKPFIAYVPFHAVHSAIVTRPDLHKKYKNKRSQDKRHKNVKYAGFVEHLDQIVGRIMAEVDQLGLAENTVILFTSDNGGVGRFTNNTPLRNAKGSFYEGGIRVPFIVRWPDVVKPASVSEQPIHFVDVYPTLMEVAGADSRHITQSLDGISVAPVLTGQKADLDRDSLYWHFPGYMDSRNSPRSLIQKRVDGDLYKLFFDYLTGEYQLYNISNDQGEKKNLLDSPNPRIRSIALNLNADLRTWLMARQAPTGTWRVNGGSVPYPPENMIGYAIPDQTTLKPADLPTAPIW